MKSKLISMFLLPFFLIGCSNNIDNIDRNKIPKSELAVNSLLTKIAEAFKEKYKIKPIGTNIAMPGGVVKLLGLEFQVQGTYPKERIREILISLVQDFQNFVNSDKEIKLYLLNYPFLINEIDITLYFVDSKGLQINYPNIGIAEAVEGDLTYKTLNRTSENYLFIQSRFTESYQEALKAISNKKDI